MDISWGLALIPFISAGAGAYFGGYLKKKGENLATHEDIEKLVDQVRAVTLATKEIEAKVSSDIWSQQKRWELKRETLFDATKRLAELNDALAGLHSMMQVEQQETERGQRSRQGANKAGEASEMEQCLGGSGRNPATRRSCLRERNH
jgi:hypothetical protein